jgi:predicted esterase
MPEAESTGSFVHVFRPAPEPGSPTTLLLLHGTGGNERDLLPVGELLAPNAAFLSPRGPVLENGAPRFFRRLAEGVFDLPDLVARTDALADFVTDSVRAYRRDPKRVIAVGFSNGANIAAAMMLLRPEVLQGGVLIRAMVPLIPEKPPQSSARVQLLSGLQDPIVPVEQPQRLAELLRVAGATVELIWNQAGHSLTSADIRFAQRWLAPLL